MPGPGDLIVNKIDAVSTLTRYRFEFVELLTMKSRVKNLSEDN